MYTGVSEKEDNSGNKIVRQTQCIAIGDGINYEKLDCNPVITHEQLPEGSSKEDFRDQKFGKKVNGFTQLLQVELLIMVVKSLCISQGI